MAKHKPRKSAPTEYTTDDEDMIMYDMEEELEPNPKDKFAMTEYYRNNPDKYMRALTPTRFRKKKGISVYSLNCQSLREHALDFNDSIMQHGIILRLTESWINKEENIDFPNFHYIAKFQRQNHRAGGVSMYKNKGDTTTYVTSEMDVASNTTE
ncbi:uncharacterized protein TNCV_1671 [Trichonephila clavipes]|nr:uncharacterized protein TNCV_1671 [Trichonephila clavipes]